MLWLRAGVENPSLKRISQALVWTLGVAAVMQGVFVSLQFYRQGIARADLDDLRYGIVHYDFLGEFGFGIALATQTFGYSLLIPLALISLVLCIYRRYWFGLAVTLIAPVPWLLVLGFRERLVEWMWL